MEVVNRQLFVFEGTKWKWIYISNATDERYDGGDGRRKRYVGNESLRFTIFIFEWTVFDFFTYIFTKQFFTFTKKNSKCIFDI